MYINETIQKKKHNANIAKHSKYKYTYYQNIYTLKNPHVHTPTHYKTRIYTHPHITKPTCTHTHTLQNKLKLPQQVKIYI